MQKTFQMTATKIAHDGAAEGLFEATPVQIHGMLPGEEGIVEVTKKHGIFTGELKEIIKSSPQRLLPNELHYLSCSPWQVMEYPLQATLKKEMLETLFGYYEDAAKVEFVPADKLSGYRTKVEFSFTDRLGDVPAPLSLAFHVRGGGHRRMPLPDGCMLCSDNMNSIALSIVERLRERAVEATDLKTLIVRESKSTGKCLAILYVKTESEDKQRELCKLAVDDIPNLNGFLIYYSTAKSPASVPTKELLKWGDEEIIESVSGVEIRYFWEAFFQNNIPMFEKACATMKESMIECNKMVELYSGVGTIGLLLASKAKKVIGVEIIEGAVASAEGNAKRNNISHYEAIYMASEKIDDSVLDGADVLVLDPPRVGLHKKVIELILQKTPKQILYLSCNPETQARDYSALKERYKIERAVGYDFYPQTPHAESLLVLSLRP